MASTVLFSGRDTLLLTLPLLGMMFLGVFRVDHLVAASKASGKQRRPDCGTDDSGREILCDPDGRLPKPTRQRHPQSTVVEGTVSHRRSM